MFGAAIITLHNEDYSEDPIAPKTSINNSTLNDIIRRHERTGSIPERPPIKSL